MTAGRSRAVGVLLVSVAWLTAFGGGCSNGGGAVEAPELGMSMPVPAGWSVDDGNSRLCFRGQATGIVLDEPLHGVDLDRHVDGVLGDFGAEVRSRAARTVSGLPAVEAVVDYPSQGSTALKLFVDRAGTLVEVSFVTPADEYADQEPALRAALDGIRFD